MKPYILSYSETVEIEPYTVAFDIRKQVDIANNSVDISVETLTRETSDQDFIDVSPRTAGFISKKTSLNLMSTTRLTESIEQSDDDYINDYYDSTFMTKSSEPSDNDF